MRVTCTGAAAAATAALVAAGITALGTVTPAAASSAARQLAPVTISHPGGHLPGFLRARKALVLQAGQQPACPAPARPGLMQCMSIHPKRALGSRPAGNPGGLAPADLRAAYSIRQAATKNGKGRTVAIVDAFSDPNAAKDVAAYRAQFHLPACGTAGGCLKIVNEWGNSKSLPKSNAGWGFEESLDLDMVSAICPNCHIVLLEARSAALADLGTAVNTAVARGIKIISNSWNSGGEFTGEQAYNKYFNHPGVAITVAAGDFGYGTAYPADMQFVTAVGGTALRRASNARGWTENAWIGGGSGCSTLEAKPSWQSADATAGTGCLNRTENDVSAVASPNTAVAVRDSFNDGPSWTQAGGTSVATPVIAGIYALAGNPAAGTYPAEYPYRNPGSFYDVTTGSNGSCESNRQYLCNAETGYDGPTGLGTPNGTGGFAGSGQLVALVDPGTQDAAAGGAFALKITGLDGNAGGSLSYGATGLTAAGLSIAPLSGSTNAQITGTLAGTPGTFPVTVTATDPKTGRSGAVSFRIVTVASLTAGTAAAGPLRFAGGTGCLDGGAGTPATKVLNQACSSATGQKWTFAAAASPGAAGGELQLSPTVCLGESGGAAVLAGCGANGTFWLYPGLGELVNRLNGGCLALPKAATGQQAATATCTGGPTQQWELTTATITSGVSGLCLAAGTSPPVAVDTCATVTGQQWRTGPAGSLISSSGNCLSMGGNPPGDMLDGTPAILAGCESAANGNNIDQVWVPGPGGELINALSGKCLADPSAGGAGTSLAQQDCYGSADEIWAIN